MKIEFVGKCLYLVSGGKGILVVGDLHLGFEESLNRAGVLITRKMFGEGVEYMDKVFEKLEGMDRKVDEIVLLGDVKHEFGKIQGQEWKDVLGLFDYLEKKISKNGKIVIVKGNHDVILEPVVNKKKKVELKEFYIIDDVGFAHGDRKIEEMEKKEIKTWVLGHGHPAVRLSDGNKEELYKCYLVGKFKRKEIIIVPSFVEYNKGTDPRENLMEMGWNFDLGKFEVKIIEEFNVYNFGKLKKLK